MTYGVYCLTNKVNGKKYIGQSKNVENRFRDLNKPSRFKYGHGVVCDAIHEFGKETFELEILFALEKIDADWRETLWVHEEYFIHKLDTTNPEKGYNLSTGGKSSQGLQRSCATKQRISKAKKGKLWSEETRKTMDDAHKKKSERRFKELREKRGWKIKGE